MALFSNLFNRKKPNQSIPPNFTPAPTTPPKRSVGFNLASSLLGKRGSGFTPIPKAPRESVGFKLASDLLRKARPTTPTIPAGATLAPVNAPFRLGPQPSPAGVKPTTPITPTAPITSPVDTVPKPTPTIPTVEKPPVTPTTPSAEDAESQRIVEERLKGIDTTKTTPITPEIEASKAVGEAEKVFEESLKVTPEELSTTADIDRLIESTKKAFLNISDQAIPLPFITGQLRSTERRALGLAEPLESKLARLQVARTSSLEASKFALERADKREERARGIVSEEKTAKEATRSSILNIASNLLTSGASQEQIKEITQSKTIDEALGIAGESGLLRTEEDGGFTLGNNQIRYNAEGEVLASNIGRNAGAGSADYTAGQNPTVDSWVENINADRAKFSDIKDEGLRNMVSNAMAAGGASTEQAKVDTLKDKLEVIDSLINHRGMAKTVGPSGTFGLSRFTPFKIDTWTADIQDFISEVHQMTSRETLQFLIDVKSAGATFGALSNQELNVLAESATKINDWEIKDKNGEGIGKWNISERFFKEELEVIRELTERALLRATGQESPLDEADTFRGEPNIVIAPDGTEIEIID